jgi:hypothetical protein
VWITINDGGIYICDGDFLGERVEGLIAIGNPDACRMVEGAILAGMSAEAAMAMICPRFGYSHGIQVEELG